MTIHFNQGDEDEDLLPYIYADNPSMADLDAMANTIGRQDFYNVVITGTPKEISPEWLARHPGFDWAEDSYAASYSIYREDFDAMLDQNATPLDAINWYLGGTGKEWLEIEEWKIVLREEPWDDTF